MASVWEVAIKAALKKLTISAPYATFMTRALARGPVPPTFWISAAGQARKRVAQIASFAADANIGPSNETDHSLLSGLNLNGKRTGRR